MNMKFVLLTSFYNLKNKVFHSFIHSFIGLNTRPYGDIGYTAGHRSMGRSMGYTRGRPLVTLDTRKHYLLM